MKKDSNKDSIRYLSKGHLKLPDFIHKKNFENSQVQTIEDTNVIRVPFGIRFSKKKRPKKNQNIATLILPITSINSPNPPPNVA